MGKWCIRAALVAGWLTASAATFAQTPPAPNPPFLPPSPTPLAPVAPPPPGGNAPPLNFSVHPPLTVTPNGLSAPNGLTPTPPAAPAEPPPVSDGPSAFTGQGDGCPPNAFNECPDCTDQPCFHIGAEYLGWKTKGENLPVLVTNGSFSDPVPAALGQPNTTVLFGPGNETTAWRSGVRVNFVLGTDRDTGYGLDGNGFVLFHHTNAYNFSGDGSAGSAVLARPFFNTVSGTEDADPVAIPNLASGTLQIRTPSILYGAELNGDCHYWCGDNHRFSLLAGFRFLSLDEALNMRETSQDLPGLGVAGNSYFLSEDFVTHNNFYAGQVGASYEFRLGPVSAALVGKVAAGPMLETIHNSAFTSITEPNGLVTTATNSALYISPNNAGVFHKTRFAVAPEGDVKLGFFVTPNLRITAGYTFLYVSSVARPGDQVNRNVNVQPVGGAAFAPLAPVPTPISTSFWAQGLDAGLEISF